MTRRAALIVFARALTYVVLGVGVPAATAAVVTHHMLDDTDWTEPQPAGPRPVPKPTPTRLPPSPAPRSTDAPWRVGDCVTPRMRTVSCSPGALQIVGWYGNPGSRPCAALPETTRVQRAGKHTLCLADH